MKSLRIFEEKKQKEKSKNREEIVQIIHTIYLDFMQEKNYTTNYFMHTAKPLLHLQKKLNVKDTVVLCFSNHSIILYMD